MARAIESHKVDSFNPACFMRHRPLVWGWSLKKCHVDAGRVAQGQRSAHWTLVQLSNQAPNTMIERSISGLLGPLSQYIKESPC